MHVQQGFFWVRMSCLPPHSKAAGAATARLRLGVIIAAAILAGCATRVEVVPIHKSQFITQGASFPVTRLWWSEDSLNRKVVHRHNLGRRIRKDPERALVELDDVVSRSQQTEE